MSNLLHDSLRKCTIENNVVKLPEEFLTNYDDVRRCLVNAGAKYKRNTFVFPSDAQPFMDRLLAGDKVNLRKEFQFFPTPDALADELVRDASITAIARVLEPSAGQGALIKAMIRAGKSNPVWAIELMPENAKVIATMELPNIHVTCRDFLSPLPVPGAPFDRIIANPPFSKNQDIDHIYKMYECLKPGGRMVTIASKHFMFSNNKKETNFRLWLGSVATSFTEIPGKSFSESGTNIETIKIIIDK